MRPHLTRSQVQTLKPTVLAGVLLVAFLVLCAVGIVSSRAQSSPDDSTEERNFKSTIPAHVPLKVKLKNEQAFKNVKNKNWVRDLEIEVKNTGNKPIYFMYMVIVMPDVTIGSFPYGMQLRYGRKDLVRLSTPIRPDDVPILPGETVILKVSENQLKAYERSRDEEKRNDAKKIEFDLQLINFGDGTGLRGMDGRPTPDANTTSSSCGGGARRATPTQRAASARSGTASVSRTANLPIITCTHPPTCPDNS